MFEFRPGETAIFYTFDKKPDVHRSKRYLVRLTEAELPEGLEFTPKAGNDPKTPPLPYAVQMMLEVDDGWAWDYPDFNARDYLGMTMREFAEDWYKIGDWLWMVITEEEATEEKSKDTKEDK